MAKVDQIRRHPQRLISLNALASVMSISRHALASVGSALKFVTDAMSASSPFEAFCIYARWQTQQRPIEDWRFAKAWSMVFTSFVTGLSHEVMVGSMSLEHRMNGLESALGSGLASGDYCSSEKESSSKGLRVVYTLPLPDW